LSGPSAGPAGGRAAEGGFHHVLEALIAERALLVGVCAQALQVVGRDACVQQLSMVNGVLVWVASQRRKEEFAHGEDD